MFTGKYSHGKKFNVDDAGFEFISLDDYVSKFNPSAPIKVLGMFTYTGKYGDRAVIVADGYKINLPDHLTPDVKSILATPEEVQAINDGACGFKCSTYQDKNGKTRNSGSFVDI